MLLKQVIAQVESAGKQHAIRFEPVLFQNKPLWITKQIPFIQYAHGSMSYDTALMLACTSFGLYQILGANVWSQRFAGTFFDYCENSADQDRAFQDFIAPHGFVPFEDCKDWATNRYSEFASFYNGPAAVDEYVESMRRVQGL